MVLVDKKVVQVIEPLRDDGCDSSYQLSGLVVSIKEPPYDTETEQKLDGSC